MNNKYINISDLTKYLKTKFDSDDKLQKVFLKGEISNFKAHSRGHFYFSLKDENSKINAIMFSFNAKNLKFIPMDGMNVLVTGKISIYEATGNYQIYVDTMEDDGLGNLYKKFELLKEELSKAGLFDPSHKQKIPKIPKTIGIVTAPTGAAIRDIISTLNRRWPSVKTILFPALVQGDNAASSIAHQIEIANTYDIDILIVGRGGGSIEDLWAFNEKEVAYAIFNSKVPIISAVGHEIDFTIADFVADLRAPTPTGAAELSVPNIDDFRNYCKQINIRLKKSLEYIIQKNKKRLDFLKNSYVLKNPLALYEIKEQKLSSLIDRLTLIMQNKLQKEKHNFDIILNKLELLNPLNLLKKGFSVVEKDNELVKTVDTISRGDLINIKFCNGLIKAEVLEVEKNERNK